MYNVTDITNTERFKSTKEDLKSESDQIHHKLILDFNFCLENPTESSWTNEQCDNIVEFFRMLSDTNKEHFWTKVCSASVSEGSDYERVFNKIGNGKNIKFFVGDEEVSELEFFERKCKAHSQHQQNEIIKNNEPCPKSKSQFYIVEKIANDLISLFKNKTKTQTA